MTQRCNTHTVNTVDTHFKKGECEKILDYLKHNNKNIQGIIYASIEQDYKKSIT